MRPPAARAPPAPASRGRRVGGTAVRAFAWRRGRALRHEPRRSRRGDAGAVAEADRAIAASSAPLAHGGAVIHHRKAFPDDPHLLLW